jgi:hypothetical protein
MAKTIVMGVDEVCNNNRIWYYSDKLVVHIFVFTIKEQDDIY